VILNLTRFFGFARPGDCAATVWKAAGDRRAIEPGCSAARLRLSTSIRLMTFSGVAVGDGVGIAGS
jgi:hypothetical protein